MLQKSWVEGRAESFRRTLLERVSNTIWLQRIVAPHEIITALKVLRMNATNIAKPKLIFNTAVFQIVPSVVHVLFPFILHLTQMKRHQQKPKIFSLIDKRISKDPAGFPRADFSFLSLPQWWVSLDMKLPTPKVLLRSIRLSGRISIIPWMVWVLLIIHKSVDL